MLQRAGADAETITALGVGTTHLRALARDDLPLHTRLAIVNRKVAKLEHQRRKVEEEIGKLEAQRDELEGQMAYPPHGEEDNEATFAHGVRSATHDAHPQPRYCRHCWMHDACPPCAAPT